MGEVRSVPAGALAEVRAASDVVGASTCGCVSRPLAHGAPAELRASVLCSTMATYATYLRGAAYLGPRPGSASAPTVEPLELDGTSQADAGVHELSADEHRATWQRAQREYAEQQGWVVPEDALSQLLDDRPPDSASSAVARTWADIRDNARLERLRLRISLRCGVSKTQAEDIVRELEVIATSAQRCDVDVARLRYATHGPMDTMVLAALSDTVLTVCWTPEVEAAWYELLPLLTKHAV